jgi:hypothetical protein
MRRRDPEARYREKVRHEQKTLEEYAAHEEEWAGNLILWFRVKHLDPPDDEYRAIAFFRNREYRLKPGSLTLLYSLYRKLLAELPPVTKENTFDVLRYRFRVYALALEKGGWT